MGRPGDLRQCNSLNNNLIRTQRSRGKLAERCCGVARPGRPVRTARHFILISAPRASQERLIGKSDMQRMTIVAMAAMLVAAPAFAEGTGSGASDAGITTAQAKPAAIAPASAAPAAHPAPAKPAVAASTPEARSAAALALSHEPTYDEGSAQRIREAALSYSDLSLRGGWPAIPADAKFANGNQGPNDDLLRKRLIVSGDLAVDKATGAYDDALAEAAKRFQARHDLALTRTVTPRTLAALNVPLQMPIKQ